MDNNFCALKVRMYHSHFPTLLITVRATDVSIVAVRDREGPSVVQASSRLDLQWVWIPQLCSAWSVSLRSVPTRDPQLYLR
jgi:hypothetical protein